MTTTNTNSIIKATDTTIKKPHCWGKMNWILKYQSGMEPAHAICRCEYGSLKCKLLTRQAAR